jgi:hypothetical protein
MDDNPYSAPQGDLPDQPTPTLVLRLTIRQMVLWALCSGFVAWRGSPPSTIEQFFGITIKGGMLAGSVTVIYTCTRFSSWSRTQPGHWFALVGAWEYVEMIAVTPICKSLLPIRVEYIYCIAFIGMAAILMVGAILGRWEWYWQLAISLHALDEMSSTAWRLAQEWWGWPGIAEFIRNTATPAIGVAAVLVLLASIGLDLYRKRYRDWLHWCGIAWFLYKWHWQVRAYVIPHFFPPE